jgi:PAS domain S-box-containing protein
MAEQINILIVDDEPRNLTVLETTLDDPAYKLVRAQSADEALLALISDEYALLILDIHMPGMSGFELAQLVKQRRKTAEIPIIFLTAHYNEDEHVSIGYETGAVDYLYKPVNQAMLRSKVAVFTDLYRKGRELTSTNRLLMTEVAERRRAESELRDLNAELDRRVGERTEALRSSEERLRLAIEAAQLGMWDWNLRSGELVWSPRHELLFGYEPGTPSRKLGNFEERVHPDDREEVMLAIDEAKRTGTDYRREYRVVWLDKSVHWIHASGSFIYDSDGEPMRMTGMIMDVSERKRAEEQMALLLAEVNHRAKNMLGLVEAIARQTLAGNPKDFAQNFSQRIQALSASQNLLVASKWTGVGLQDLVCAQMALFADIGTRIRPGGPSLRLSATAAQALGMALHELATNAVKYGALSNSDGFVSITWHLPRDARLTIKWREEGGPPVVPPATLGFGSVIVDAAIKAELNAEVSIDYATEGLTWQASLPTATSLEAPQ